MHCLHYFPCQQESGQYGWVDGWPLTYDDWKANAPVGGECVVMDPDLGWIDVACNENHGFFCKYTEGQIHCYTECLKNDTIDEHQVEGALGVYHFISGLCPTLE